MSKVEYCPECGRAKGIACTCGMTFAEKARSQNLNWATWSATR